MIVKYGNGKTKYGSGVSVDLSGDEVAIAISAYIVAHRIYIDGARTITVNGKLIQKGHIYVDPAGSVISEGIRYSGRGRGTERG